MRDSSFSRRLFSKTSARNRERSRAGMRLTRRVANSSGNENVIFRAAILPYYHNVSVPLSREVYSRHLKSRMDAPEQDLADRRPIWDVLQMFWMDTDPTIFLSSAAQACVHSKYSLTEIEHIFWNEVALPY